MTVEFSKYEGAGNDFIVIDNRAGTFGASGELVRAVCDRRFGIGADGLMLLEEAPELDFRMRYFNSDGPEASMCGNGGRCITLFAHHLGIGGPVMAFAAADGTHRTEVVSVSGEEAVIRLQMMDVEGVRPLGNGFFLDTGSPHYVEFVDDIDKVDVIVKGREIRYSEALAPGGANVNLVEITGPGSIRLRTYERGVEDETMACGTGAVASAIIAAKRQGFAVSHVSVETRGGELSVAFGADYENVLRDVWLTGPARRVFRGELETENFSRRRFYFKKNR